MKNQIFILALIALISSCTVVKRVHQPGYYVAWNKHYKTLDKNTDQAAFEQIKESDLLAEKALVDEQIVINQQTQEPTILVDEVSISSHNEIVPIVVASENSAPQDVQIKHLNKSYEKSKNAKIKATSSSSSSGGKSQGVALVLAILLGGIGIHRFYLGHIGMGILYLCTAGLCGIGWLIDIILIATGSLEPKDGSYDKTL